MDSSSPFGCYGPRVLLPDDLAAADGWGRARVVVVVRRRHESFSPPSAKVVHDRFLCPLTDLQALCGPERRSSGNRGGSGGSITTEHEALRLQRLSRPLFAHGPPRMDGEQQSMDFGDARDRVVCTESDQGRLELVV